MDPSTFSPSPTPTPPPVQSVNTQQQYSSYSANSKNIKRFQASQKMKNILFVFIVGIPITIGVVAYIAYRRYVTPSNALIENSSNSVIENPESINTLNPNAATQNNPSTDNPDASNATPPGSQQNNSQAPSDTSEQSRSQNDTVPPGVISAINSIEKNGMKNNPYVAFDTSSIPDGTVIRLERKSWTQFASDGGSVEGTVSAYGKTNRGMLTFGLVDGSWKVVSYMIDA
jgi:hypothetical protein